MKNREDLPEILFVGRKNKIRHKHIVLEVVEFDDEGWPSLLRLMREDEVVDLGEADDRGEKKAFMTAYVQERSYGSWSHAKHG